MENQYIIFFDQLTNQDVQKVGGKNSSLGEMIQSLQKENIDVPFGFATTAFAYQEFLEKNHLKDYIKEIIEKYHSQKITLKTAGKKIRKKILKSKFPENLESEIKKAYQILCEKYHQKNTDVAIRSSATAEDLPDASFAGQQESFLNIKKKKNVLKGCLKCYSSLFTNRAIHYRDEKGFDHLKISLSVGVQKMVRSDKASSGVMFTLDTDTGFPEVVTISAGYGLGENVVQGNITPDEYIVFKPLLEKGFEAIVEKNIGSKKLTMIYKRIFSGTKNIKTSKPMQKSFVLGKEEIITLAKAAIAIEKHYKKPMDIEWAKDGDSNKLYIVQARPETVQANLKDSAHFVYHLKEKGKSILEGLAIGSQISSGKIQIIKDVKNIDDFIEGNILVTKITTPDWEPIMSKASGIITDLGGRTSHAAIVSRELGVCAIVGTQKGTSILENDQKVTLSCAEGETGYIYENELPFEKEEIDLSKLPEVSIPILMNISSPSSSYVSWKLPTKGVGLARMEFIINNMIQIHPMALIEPDKIKDKKVLDKINDLTYKYKDKKEYFIDILSRGIAKIASSAYPNPTIVRLSDFKTNEYAHLIGGELFEPKEENPMIGFRGASRYYNEKYQKAFELECMALKKARESLGFDNIIVMIPFCRTVEEAEKVLKLLKEHGLEKGKNGLQIYMMCEIPSNAIIADQFAPLFDGFSIGSNDLTQLTLG
ncbi:MAG TPA: phosphoenolpyruvate synthase, partial [Chlamydiales bacterium]|nr:phosphoenolpyruvate synthase [Chlamydiales bacterium]